MSAPAVYESSKSNRLMPGKTLRDFDATMAKVGHVVDYGCAGNPSLPIRLLDCYGDPAGEFRDFDSLVAGFHVSEDKMRQCWSTPASLFGPLNYEFGLQLDCAANKYNAQRPDYITEEMDALSITTPWVGHLMRSGVRVTRPFLNPGFSNIMPWVQRMYHEVQKSPAAVGVVVTLCAPSSKWWQFCYWNARQIRLLGPKRPQFVPPPGVEPSSNARENAVVIFGHKARFAGGHAEIITWDFMKAPTGKG